MDQPDTDELIAPFAVPAAILRGGQQLIDGPMQMPWYEYDEAGERLMSFARHGAYQ